MGVASLRNTEKTEKTLVCAANALVEHFSKVLFHGLLQAFWLDIPWDNILERPCGPFAAQTRKTEKPHAAENIFILITSKDAERTEDTMRDGRWRTDKNRKNPFLWLGLSSLMACLYSFP